MSLFERLMERGYPSRIEEIRGIKIRVRGASVAEQRRYAGFEHADDGAQHAVLELCSDPATELPAFAALDEVRQLPLAIALQLREAIDELTLLTEEAVAAAGKDSSPTRTSDSGSSSPRDSA